jgi:sugar transferase (PEP-CTERM/EpsH1 system associated)
MPSLRILFLTPYVPSLLRIRSYGFLTRLAQRGHRIALLSVASSPDDFKAAAALQPHCERIELVQVSPQRALLNCLRGMPSGLPLQALYCYSPAVRQRLADLLAGATRGGAASATDKGAPFDVVHIEHLRAALLGLDAARLPRLYDAVDCITELFEMTQHHGGTRLSRMAAAADLPRTRHFERRLTRIFEAVVVTSEAEANALTRLQGEHATARQKIRVVPNGVDLEYFSPAAGEREPATLLFVGRMSYHANVAAVLDFMTQAMPLVWAARPETRVVICGAEPVPAIRRLPQRFGERVLVTGTVADVRPYQARATVSVNPLRYAAGIQNKVLEAMAAGMPVVASPAACAGLAARHPEDLLIGADHRHFAAHVLRLLSDPALRHWLAAAGRRYVETRHDWSQAAEGLEAAYQDAISRRHRERAAAE